MTTPTKALDAALSRLSIAALAAHRARQACNGQHADAELRRLLNAALRANEALAEAVFLHAEAHAAVHQKEGA